MNLEQIRYFLAVADTGLVHRAASQIGVSQPALTKSLQRLEVELDVPLFERHAQGMRLTVYGKVFVEDARSLLALYDESLRRLGEMHAAAAARVEAGATPATEPLMDRAFVTVLRRRPALRLHLRVEMSDQLIASLEAGRIDFALVPIPAEISGNLTAETLFEESSWIVCRKEHPLLLRQQDGCAGVPPEALTNYAWVLPRTSISIRREIEAWFELHQLGKPQIQSERHVSGSSSVFNLLAQTDLLGICSTQFHGLAEQFGLCKLPCASASWPRRIALLRRSVGRFSPVAQELMEQIRLEASALEKLVAKHR